MVLIPQQSIRVPQAPQFTSAQVVPMRSAGPAQLQQLGAAMQSAGAGIERFGVEREERLHIAAVKEAQALAEERIADADRSYMTTLGKAATGANRDQAWKILQDQLTSIESGLDHDVERRLFREVARRRLLNVRSRWGQHEDRQVLAYEIGASKAVLEAKKTAARMQGPQQPVGEALRAAPEAAAPAAGANAEAPGFQSLGFPTVGPEFLPGVPGLPTQAPEFLPSGGAAPAGGEPAAAGPRATLLDSVRSEARSLAGKLGYGPEQTDAFVTNQVGEVHIGVVEDLVADGRGTEAREYLQGIAPDDIAPEERRKLRSLVQRATLQDESLRLSLELQNLAPRRAAEPVAPGTAEAEAPPSTPPLGITMDEIRADSALWDQTSPAQRTQIEGSQASTRVEMVSAAQLEAFATGELNRRFLAGEITAELRDLTLDRIGHAAAALRRQAADRENGILDRAEQWAVENRGLGLSDMPPDLYQGVAQIGRLPEITSFLRTGRHTNDPAAVAEFMRMPASTLRSILPVELRALLRTKMDNETLAWALSAQAAALKPGTDIEAAYEKRIMEQRLVEFGRGTDAEGFFLTDFTTKPTAKQAERENRIWLRYLELKEAMRASGQNITPEVMDKLLDRAMFDEQVSVYGMIDNLYGIPISTLTPDEFEQSFVEVKGERVYLSEIPGTRDMRGPLQGQRDEFPDGDVRGKIMNQLLESKPPRPQTPQNIVSEWLWHGRPETVTEYDAARAAGNQILQRSMTPGDPAVQREAQRAAQYAIEQIRGHR